MEKKLSVAVCTIMQLRAREVLSEMFDMYNGNL